MVSNQFVNSNTRAFLSELRNNIVDHQTFFEGEIVSLTYGDLFRKCDLLCAFFKRQGLLPGDRIAIALEDDVCSVVTFVSSMWFGLELCMIDPDAPIPECQKTLELLKPDHLLLSPKCRSNWAFLDEGTDRHQSLITIDDHLFSTLSRELSATNRFEPADRSFEDPFMIVLTSGTTGNPKGVVLSYKAILTQSMNMGAGIDFGSGSRILNLFRLSQIGSVVNGILLALLHGGTLVRPFQKFDFSKSRQLLSRIVANPVSHFIFVPSLISCLFRDREAFEDAFAVSDFRFFVTTAAPISDDLWQQIETQTGKVVINTFGSSEVNNVTFTSRNIADERIGTIGSLLDAECKVVGETGDEVSPGETGELWIRSETRMTAYLNAPELTECVLVDGWVKTGDLAYLSGENLVYVGRSVESIISGGHTIFPNEINNLILSHPDVADAYTFGKSHPEWGELVAACIVPVSTDLTAPTISSFLRERLSMHKIPRKIVFVDRIPLNDRGKVRLQEIQKLVP